MTGVFGRLARVGVTASVEELAPLDLEIELVLLALVHGARCPVLVVR